MLDEQVLERSIEFASFENMKRMERAGEFSSGTLQPRDPGDAESYKVRRGIIGGYRQYLDGADIDFVETALERLDNRFAY